MNLFSIDNLSIEEISALRHALNVIDIKGSSAQFIANLQIKLDADLTQIQDMLRTEEEAKLRELNKITKSSKTTS